MSETADAAVVPFRLVGKEPVEAVVARIKELLASAESGEIQGLAFAARLSDGSFETHWVSGIVGVDFSLAVGISHLTWRYHNEAFSEELAEHSP